MTPMMKPTPTTCMAMSLEMPNREQAMGMSSSEPPATPDALHAGRECSGQIQQRFGSVFADISHADIPLALRLQDQFILSLLKKILKIQQIL